MARRAEDDGRLHSADATARYEAPARARPGGPGAAVEGAPDAALLLHLAAAGGNAMVLRLLGAEASGPGDPSGAPAGLAGRIRDRLGEGNALTPDVRADLEHGFGADLGGVRLHRDGAAAGLAADVHARAFTTGQDVFFGSGAYDPSSEPGYHLLAHEVAHTLQPESTANPVRLTAELSVTDPGGPDERAADAAARELSSRRESYGMALWRRSSDPAARELLHVADAADAVRDAAATDAQTKGVQVYRRARDHAISRLTVARAPAGPAPPAVQQPAPAAATRTAAVGVDRAVDALTMALAMPNLAAHREEIFRALLDVGGARTQLADAFQRTAGRPLEATLAAELSTHDWFRARSYLRHGRLRTADKIIIAADGLASDEDTLYRLMREARQNFTATEADLVADYADVYSGTGRLFNLSESSRVVGILRAELSDWELDKAMAMLAFGTLRPVDELRVATNQAGTDEDMIFAALGRADRATIAQEWRQYYGEQAGGAWATLDGLLGNELSGNDLVKARAMVAGTWDVRSQIRMAVEGWGTKDEMIWGALEHLTPGERSVLQAEWRARGEVWQLLDDDLDSDDMRRAEALIMGASDGLSRLQQAGATGGSSIVDAIKMSRGPAFEVYKTEWGSATSNFRSWVSDRTDDDERAAIQLILYGSPAAQLRWCVDRLGTDEDYIFHVLGGLNDDQKAAVAADRSLMDALSSDLSTSDFNRVLDLLRRSNLTTEEQVAATDAQIERERSWITDAFSNTSDALADEQREMHSLLDRSRTDAELSPEEQRQIGARQAATQEALTAYIAARDELENLATNILTTAAAIIVSICTAGAAAGAGAAMIAAQLAAQAARAALVSAITRVVATKVARGDRFDAFGADGAIAFAAGAADGVLNVFGPRIAQTLINPAFRTAASAEARALAVQAWEGTVGRRLVQSAVEGGLGGAVGGVVETGANENTWKGGFEQGFRTVAEATGGGVLTGAAMGTAMTGATEVVGAIGGGGEAGTHLPSRGTPDLHGTPDTGVALPRPDTPAVRALPAAGPDLVAGLPADLRPRTPVLVDADLGPTAVRVHYDVDADGLVTGIHLRVGAQADAATIGLHAGVVRAMERYAGFSGRIRLLLRRIAEFVGANGEPAPGTLAFEARLEVGKLPAIINERLDRLQRGGLDAVGESALRAEIGELEAQLVHHQRTVDRLDFESAGRGFVAADPADLDVQLRRLADLRQRSPGIYRDWEGLDQRLRDPDPLVRQRAAEELVELEKDAYMAGPPTRPGAAEAVADDIDAQEKLSLQIAEHVWNDRVKRHRLARLGVESLEDAQELIHRIRHDPRNEVYVRTTPNSEAEAIIDRDTGLLVIARLSGNDPGTVFEPDEIASDYLSKKGFVPVKKR